MEELIDKMRDAVTALEAARDAVKAAHKAACQHSALAEMLVFELNGGTIMLANQSIRILSAMEADNAPRT